MQPALRVVASSVQSEARALEARGLCASAVGWQTGFQRIPAEMTGLVVHSSVTQDVIDNADRSLIWIIVLFLPSFLASHHFLP